MLWGTPHIPRQGLRPCNPLPALADERSSPVVDAHWCDIVSIRSKSPLDLNTDPTLVAMSAHGALRIAR